MTEQTEQEKIIRALRAVSKAGSSDINCLARRAADEIERLRSALRYVLDDIRDYEWVNNLAPNPPRTHCWDSVALAWAVLSRKTTDE